MTYEKKPDVTTEVRQGSRKKANLRVLLGSMFLAIVLGGLLYIWFSAGPRLEQPAAAPAAQP